MARRLDWPERLNSVLSEWRNRSFRWGQSDCVHFARDVLGAVSARDWAAVDLPLYATRRAAQSALSACGFLDLSSAVTALLGQPIPSVQAQRGDLVALPTSFGVALGVCLGAHAASIGRRGLVLCPMSFTLHSWRV